MDQDSESLGLSDLVQAPVYEVGDTAGTNLTDAIMHRWTTEHQDSH